MVNLTLTKHAHLTWLDKVNKHNKPSQIIKIFNQLNHGLCELDGDYIMEYRNKVITGRVKDNKIIGFKVKSLLEITAHAYSRWRDRIDKNCTNKEIYSIFEKLDYNHFDPSKDGKYIIEYNKLIIKAVIKGNKIITFIV